MDGENVYAFDEWVNQTRLHPLGLALTLVCGAGVLALPRHLAFASFIVIACFVAPAQRLVIMGLDFNLMRVLVIFGLIRVVLRSEWKDVRWHLLDLFVLLHAVSRTAIWTLQYLTPQALTNQLGANFEAVGMYVVFRCLLRSLVSVRNAMVVFSIVSVPVSGAFIVEASTGRNLFAFFGGVPEYTMIRDGRLRCQGAFAHPIVAGCFWAVLVPLMAVFAISVRGKQRFLMVVGLAGAMIVIGACASSTPVVGVLAACVGGALFFARRRMGWILLGVCALLVALHMSMKQPVWHLVSRITIASGNTGYHRFVLIDNAINRFDEWWLLGTRSTAHWGFGADDVTNQYIAEGVIGGMLGLLMFLGLIWTAFRSVGMAWRAAATDIAAALMAWSVGVAIFVHVMNFIALTYFGQAVFSWFLTLALAGLLRERALEAIGRTHSTITS